MKNFDRPLPYFNQKLDCDESPPVFLDANKLDENQLYDALQTNIPIKFNLSKRWLKGPEYAHIIRNMNSYREIFGLQLFSPKTHPGSIYMEPEDGMIYFVEGNTIGSDFGFPRLGIKKKYKWKKMNFTTDLPKRNPLVSYIVASAVQCEKFFPENINTGPAFRMHAVILSKDLAQQPSEQEKKQTQKGRARSQSLDGIVNDHYNNNENDCSQNKNGKGATSKITKKYILCHIRKVNPKIEQLGQEEENEMESNLVMEEDNSSDLKNMKQLQMNSTTLLQQKGSAVLQNNEIENKNKVNVRNSKNSENSKSSENQQKTVQVVDNNLYDKSTSQLNTSTRKSSNTYITDQFHNPQGFQKIRIRQRYYTDSYNLQDYGHCQPDKVLNKEFSSDPAEKTPTQEDLYALYENDSEDEDTYINKQPISSCENKRRLQKQQRKDNSQKSLLQQTLPQQAISSGPQMFASSQILGRKLSYQPKCEPEPEMAQDALLVKNLMSLNKKFSSVNSDDHNQLKFSSFQGTPQNYQEKLNNQPSPQSQGYFSSKNLITPKNNRVFRKFSDILSESENSIKGQQIINSHHSAFKPVEKSGIKYPNDANSLIAPFIHSFNLNKQSSEVQNVNNYNNLQKQISLSSINDQAYINQNNPMASGLASPMNIQINPLQSLISNQTNMFNPLNIAQQQVVMQYQLMMQSQQDILNQNSVFQDRLFRNDLQRQLPIRKLSSPNSFMSNEAFLFNNFARNNINNQ